MHERRDLPEQRRLIRRAIETRRIDAGRKLRAGQRGGHGAPEREVPRARHGGVVEPGVGGQAGEHALDERRRRELVELAAAREHGHVHTRERAGRHQPRQRGRE